jgi:predicted DsbA family dithiol-disulfide isomerase
MTVHIEVWSDYVCPYCFAVSFSLRDLEQTHDVAVRWRAFELRPAGSPPMPPDYLARIEQARPRFAQMMRERHGIEIRPGPFGIVSRPALIAAKWGEVQGETAGRALHEALLRAYWQQGRDIGHAETLATIAQETGLDGDALLAALASPDFDRQVQTDIVQAHTYGLNGVPALLFERRYLISGAQPADFLRQVVEQLSAGTPG